MICAPMRLAICTPALPTPPLAGDDQNRFARAQIGPIDKPLPGGDEIYPDGCCLIEVEHERFPPQAGNRDLDVFRM